MKAMLLNNYGADASFNLTEVQEPTLTSGHVIIRIKAVSVNTVDTMIKTMGADLPLSPELPAILGMDFAGVIEFVAEDVTDYKIGDEVYGCAGGLADLKGSLAELMLADVNLIAHKPKSLSMREAAALPLVGITAYEGLKRAQIKSGQDVLIHGGAGGVGHVAIQLAQHWGANIYATGTGQPQLDVIQSYGATAIDFMSETVADYVARYTNGSGFEVIFDSVGGANLSNSFEAAALNANIATTVSLLEQDLTVAHFKGLSLHVVFMLIPMLHNHNRSTHGDILADLAHIVDAGALTPLLDDHHYSFEQTGDAYNRLQSGQAIGKVVIEL